MTSQEAVVIHIGGEKMENASDMNKENMDTDNVDCGLEYLSVKNVAYYK